MIETLKRFATHGCCFAGVLAVGAIAVGTSALTGAAATELGGQTNAALLADQQGQVPAVRQHADTVAKSYLAVQKLLAQDKLQGVTGELKKIHEAANALAEAGKGEAATQAKTVAKHADVQPKNLKEARAAFKPLSSSVIGLVNVVPPSADVAPALYEASCPMAKANWLQGTKEINNPYMGQEMLDCGSVERKIEPAAGGKDKKEQTFRGSQVEAIAAGAGGSSCCASVEHQACQSSE